MGKIAAALAAASVIVVGGTPAQRALARLTANRVGGITLSRVVFRSPTRALRHEHVHGVEMVVSSRGPDTVRSNWEQQLYIGAYLTYMTRWPKGEIAAAAGFHTEGPADRLNAYDVYGSNPKTSVISGLTRRLIDAAAQAKARIVEERIASLPARAIALTLRVDDPAAFLKHRASAFIRLLWPLKAPILGYYLGVEDASGALVFATSRLPNTGSVSVIPSLDSCSPVGHTEMGLQPPPPCPAR
jgi:hypothetical protein